MGDWGLEMRHRDFEDDCSKIERMKEMYPRREALALEAQANWFADLMTEAQSQPYWCARAWIGLVWRWLEWPLVGQGDLFDGALEELMRLRKEMYHGV